MPIRNERVVLMPRDRRAAVLELIRSAQERLVLSMFRCDDRRVLEALGDAHARGVSVEVLLTRRSKEKSHLKLLRWFLQQLGVCVWRYADPFVKYHAKYLVADGRRAIVGSLNLTRRSFKKSSDFAVLTDDPPIVAGLTALFDHDRMMAPLSSVPFVHSPRLIIGPDHTRGHIGRLIAQARRSIQIIDAKLNDPAMRALLDSKVAAGVDVAILGTRKIGGRPSHGKLMILDGKLAVIGSVALSGTSLDIRREVALIVDEVELVRELANYFEAMTSDSHLLSPGRAQVESAA